MPRATPARPSLVLALAILALVLSGCIDAPGDGVKIITVGASDLWGHVAGFSGSGPLRDGRIKPDVVAPGANVISAAPAGLSRLDYVDSFYAKASGTSLATPAAAGVAALLLQTDPSTAPAGIKAALARGARRLNNTLGEEYEPFYQGAGLIDAGRSHDILSAEICGVAPDRWIAGRWAFLPDSFSPGIDVGADRRQKKIYALAPGDSDWTSKFLFFTNGERRNISLHLSGDAAGWITAMPLPKMIPANGQVVFAATMAVPGDTPSGTYHGSIMILDEGRQIASLPVMVQVPRPLSLTLGSGAVDETIGRNQWHYYYTDVPVGARNLTARLSWSGSSNLDAVLLDPSGYCHSNERARGREEISLLDPVSGRYIVAVHARSISSPENYTLRIEEAIMDLLPSSLDLGRILPGETKTAELKLVNSGLPLDDLRIVANMEKKSTTYFHGEVARDETWEDAMVVAANVSRLSLNLLWGDEECDLDLVAYKPSGSSAGSSYGAEGPFETLEIHNPPQGKWKLSVTGYEVPRETSQPFDLYVTSYSLDTVSDVRATGPSKIASGRADSIAVTVKAPHLAEGQEKRGYLELEYDNYSLRVPIVYTVVGASIRGIASPAFNDSDQDGNIDHLTVGVNVSAAVPGVYEVRGAVNDCSGRMIEWISNSSRIDRAGVIDLAADGREIWKRGACGPLRIGDLLLYNPQGDLVERFNASISIEKVPQDFQAPAAYMNGTFLNLSETKRGAITRVAVGVGVSVLKSGSYLISASLQQEEGTEVAAFDRTLNLSEGNHTVVVEFNARKFGKLKDRTRLFLRELAITREEEKVDEIEEAWISGEMNFGG